MKKNKLVTFIVVVLLLLNFAILGFLFLSKSDRNTKEPREVIIEKLHFDAQQVEDYDKLITLHRKKIRDLHDSVKNCKNKLYGQLQNVQKTQLTDSLFTKIARYQYQMEQAHYDHFLDIKKICKPNQLEDYNELTAELSEMFNDKKPRRER